jgi:hypothetical protein
MKTIVAALFLSSVAPAFAPKPCDELKSEIVAKLEAKGVKDYHVDIVAAEEVRDQTVIGSCELGKKRITYTRDGEPKVDSSRKGKPDPAHSSASR